MIRYRYFPFSQTREIKVSKPASQRASFLPPLFRAKHKREAKRRKKRKQARHIRYTTYIESTTYHVTMKYANLIPSKLAYTSLFLLVAASPIDSFQHFSVSKRSFINDSQQSNVMSTLQSAKYESITLRKRKSLPFSLHSKQTNDDEIVTALESGATKSSSSIASILPVVLPLLLVYISNQWSRFSLSYLVDFSNSETAEAFTAMNVDIGFSEAQYGLLASVAFTLLFAITSLFAGGLADRYDRKLLTIGSTIAWSGAVFATATSASGDYNQVLIARIFMGLACAFTTPSAYTLIKDLVPKEMTSLANSLYGSGVYLGGGLSSLSLLLDQNVGWRGTSDFVAGYGLIAAVCAAVLLPQDPKVVDSLALSPVGVTKKEDEQKNAAENRNGNQSLFSDVGEILSIPRIQWLFAGSFSRFCSGLCIGVWAAPYYKQAFPDDATSYAVINALIVGLCGVSSGVFGGWMADKTAAWSSQDGREANSGRLLVPIIGSLLAVPAWYLTAHASTFDNAMIWLAIEYLVAECWFGPTISVSSKME